MQTDSSEQTRDAFKQKPKYVWLGIAVLMLVGAYLRCYGTIFGSYILFFGGDDVGHLGRSGFIPPNTIRHDLLDIFLKSYEDAHPPIRNIVLNLILRMIDDIYHVRLIGIVPGIAVIYLSFLLGQLMTDSKNQKAKIITGFAIASIVTFQKILVVNSIETRPYMLMLFFQLTAFICLFLFINKKSISYLIAFYLSCLVCVLTDYSVVPTIALCNLVVLFHSFKTEHKTKISVHWGNKLLKINGFFRAFFSFVGKKLIAFCYFCERLMSSPPDLLRKSPPEGVWTLSRPSERLQAKIKNTTIIGSLCLLAVMMLQYYLLNQSGAFSRMTHQGLHNEYIRKGYIDSIIEMPIYFYNHFRIYGDAQNYVFALFLFGVLASLIRKSYLSLILSVVPFVIALLLAYFNLFPFNAERQCIYLIPSVLIALISLSTCLWNSNMANAMASLSLILIVGFSYSQKAFASPIKYKFSICKTNPSLTQRINEEGYRNILKYISERTEKDTLIILNKNISASYWNFYALENLRIALASRSTSAAKLPTKSIKYFSQIEKEANICFFNHSNFQAKKCFADKFSRKRIKRVILIDSYSQIGSKKNEEQYERINNMLSELGYQNIVYFEKNLQWFLIEKSRSPH